MPAGSLTFRLGLPPRPPPVLMLGVLAWVPGPLLQTLCVYRAGADRMHFYISSLFFFKFEHMGFQEVSVVIAILPKLQQLEPFVISWNNARST